MLETDEAQNVGELLRNTRLKKGKTLGDVSKDLCIRKFYLEAIERICLQFRTGWGLFAVMPNI